MLIYLEHCLTLAKSQHFLSTSAIWSE